MYGMMAPRTAPLGPNMGNPGWLLPGVFALLMLIALLLAVIGTILPDWANGKVTFATNPPQTDERKVGLWQLCGKVSAASLRYSDDCDDLLDFVKDNCPDNENNFRFLQAMAVLTCIFFVFALFTACGGLMSNFILAVIGIICLFVGLVAAFALVVGFYDQILDEDWPCMNPVNNSVVPDGDLGFGWALMCIALIIAFLAFLLGLYLLYQLYQRRNRMYMAASPMYSPMYTPPLSPVGDYRHYSPVIPSPPPPPMHMYPGPVVAGTLEDPLLARVDAVRGRLTATLANDAQRVIMTGTPPPPHPGAYIPPRPFSFY